MMQSVQTDDNDVACVAYKLPPSDREHECRLPRGCQPIRTLSEEDTPHEAPLWHEQGGRRGGPPPMQMGYQPMLPSFAGCATGILSMFRLPQPVTSPHMSTTRMQFPTTRQGC